MDGKKSTKRKSPWEIMVEENEAQAEEFREIMRQIKEESPSGIPPIIDMKLEESPNYDPNMPEEEVYREAARLNYRSFVPFAVISPDYLRSVISRYNALIPIINDEDIRQCVVNFRDCAKGSLEKIEDFLSGETFQLKNQN